MPRWHKLKTKEDNKKYLELNLKLDIPETVLKLALEELLKRNNELIEKASSSEERKKLKRELKIRNKSQVLNFVPDFLEKQINKINKKNSNLELDAIFENLFLEEENEIKTSE